MKQNKIVVFLAFVLLLSIFFFSTPSNSRNIEPKLIQQKPIFNIPTNRHDNDSFWNKIGLAHSEGSDDNSIFELYSRPSNKRRGLFYYQVKDKVSGLTLPVNENDAMDELFKNDKITILGKEGLGQFNIFIDKQSSAYY